MIDQEKLQSLYYALQAELVKIGYANHQVHIQKVRDDEFLVSFIENNNPFGMMNAPQFSIFSDKEGDVYWKEGQLGQYQEKFIN